jgi:hypothetical protein
MILQQPCGFCAGIGFDTRLDGACFSRVRCEACRGSGIDVDATEREVTEKLLRAVASFALDGRVVAVYEQRGEDELPRWYVRVDDDGPEGTGYTVAAAAAALLVCLQASR